MESETITKVLYPNDEAHQGKVLRLKQQFFFSSCSLQDMLRIHAMLGGTPATFHEKWAVQLNDTHPAVAVAELMRLLVDEHGLGWDEAWKVTRATFAYTNHTLLPEALEKWTVDLFGTLLPRHLEIVFEINRRFLDEVRAAFPGDDARLGRLSLIDESGSTLRAHGASRVRRQPQNQRRRAAPLRIAEADSAPRFCRAVAGEVSATSPTASRRGALSP